MSVTEQADRLRQAGLKVTGPRITILNAVERNSNHPSAEEIYQELSESHPSLSLSTVYGTLSTFAKAGLIRKLSEVDGRLRVEGTKDLHDHAICRVCRTIFDVKHNPKTTPKPPEKLPGGLVVYDMRVEYDVVCSQCPPPSS